MALLAGCAGARLDRGSYVVREKGYRITPPPGWERIETEADLAFRRAAVPAGLLAHGSCDGRAPGRPLPVLARHLRFGLREVRDLSETPDEVAGQPARQVRFAAVLDGQPVAVRAVTIQSPRCVYDLAVVAPPAQVDAVAADFERFQASFALLPDQP
jgi:hypothetical protein